MKKVQCRRDLRIVDWQFKALHVDAWKPGIARDGIAGPLTRMTHDQAQLGAGRRNQAHR